MKELEYSEQFLAAWGKYPHCKKPYRSGKSMSWVIWKRLKLDDSEHVKGWIEATTEPNDPYTVGFQVWLKKHDLNEKPPQSSSLPPYEHTDWSVVPSVQKHIADLAAYREAENERLKPMRDLAGQIFEQNKGWASYRQCVEEAKKRMSNQG